MKSFISTFINNKSLQNDTKIHKGNDFFLGTNGKITILLGFLVVSISLSITTWIFVKFDNALLAQEMDELSIESHLQGVRFKAQTEELIGDTLFLSNTPPVQGLMRAKFNNGIDPLDGSTEAEWRERMQQIFTQILNAKPHYIQIRFIGIENNGRELIRVDRLGDDESIRVVTGNDLQSKDQEEYYRNTLLTPRNEVALSKINLNREKNQISIPYTPVLRASIPVYQQDQSDKIIGMVVINKDMSKDFDTLVNENNEQNIYYFTNENGDYLYHTDKAKTFRFEFGESILVQDDYPELGLAYSKDDETEQIFLHTSLTGNAEIISLNKINYDNHNDTQVFGIVVKKSVDNILALSSTILNQALLILTGFVVLTFIIGVLFARRLTKPIMDITHAVQSFSEGSTDISLPVHSNDEAGILSRSFENMVTKVQERQESLEAEIIERERSEQKVRGIVDNAVDAIITIDSAATITSVNKATEEIFGYSADELIGNNIKMLMPIDYSDKHDGYINDYHRYGEKKIIGSRREVAGMRKNGTIFPLELSVSEVNIGGNISFTGIIRDFTERKEAIDSLNEHASALERSNQDLEQFAYVASHDLQEPLRMVSSYTQLLGSRYADQLDEEAHQYIQYSVDGAKRMQVLIQDLLKYSKMQKNSKNYKTVDVNEVCEDSCNNLSIAIEESGSIIPSYDLPNVKGDVVQLRQLFQNLISNALKYRKKEGTNIVNITASYQRSMIKFCIEDNGIGIAEEYLTKIFIIFRRLHLKSEYIGTGIGLALCKKIVENHGGKIWVESIENKGSRFYFTLPKI